MEKERRDRTGSWVALRREVSIYEVGRRARRVGHARHARRIGRRLSRPAGEWNDEVAVHATHYPVGHRARRASVGGVTRTRAGAWIRDESSVLELLDHGERAVLV